MRQCPRCKCTHLNPRVISNPHTTWLAIAIMAVMAWIFVMVAGEVTGGGFIGGMLLLMVGGVFIIPIGVKLASAIAKDTLVWVCHKCGMEMAGTVPTTAPSHQHR